MTMPTKKSTISKETPSLPEVNPFFATIFPNFSPIQVQQQLLLTQLLIAGATGASPQFNPLANALQLLSNSSLLFPQLNPIVEQKKNVTSENNVDDDDNSPTIATALASFNANSSEKTRPTVDGIDLDEIRQFAKAFKLRRLALGLTQTQVGQALSVTRGPAYSQSAICRFEKLDITPKSALKIKPVLEKWMQEAEVKYGDRLKNGRSNLPDLLTDFNTKKRKRRTSFSPEALDKLNDAFEVNSHPSGLDMSALAQQLNHDREVIRVWFCNKRQALKNSAKKFHSSSLQEENESTTSST